MDTSTINLLDLIGRDVTLKKVASTGNGEWHSACPFCGGKDRFVVQPNHKGGGRWSCRVCTQSWQDAIEYVKKRDGVTFVEAVERLGLSTGEAPKYSPRKVAMPTTNIAPPLNSEYIALNDWDWHFGAQDLVWPSYENLWEADGARALDYLRSRGLDDMTIEEAHLGYNPEDLNTHWGATEVWLPRGITIPWRFNYRYWRVNIRRPSGTPKYMTPAGCANGLYNADAIYPGCTIVMVEGEFDALVIKSHAKELLVRGLVPVATGTASWARVMRWVTMIGMADRVLLAFDVDQNEAGDKAAAWWAEHLGDKAQRLTPLSHDVTDMVKDGYSVRDWILNAAPELLSSSHEDWSAA